MAGGNMRRWSLPERGSIANAFRRPETKPGASLQTSHGEQMRLMHGGGCLAAKFSDFALSGRALSAGERQARAPRVNAP